jgi:PhzF family phenazine biosynthesis protein
MKTYFVDAFTNQRFKGNPAAVCLPEAALTMDEMQSIAAEIGFSETAFVQHVESNRFTIRFFTPKMEIPLCGHATLASSKIIFDSTSHEGVVFVNCNGIELVVEKAGSKIKMQFPVYETEDIEVPVELLDALGISDVITKRYSPNSKIIVIEIESASQLARLQPDFAALVKAYKGIHGVLVTSISDTAGFDFHYRYFWPWAGTNEDPVTGGVQTFLAKYWAIKLNKTTLHAFQSSLRTGSMVTEVMSDKVCILGEAVIVLEGEFIL